MCTPLVIGSVSWCAPDRLAQGQALTSSMVSNAFCSSSDMAVPCWQWLFVAAPEQSYSTQNIRALRFALLSAEIGCIQFERQGQGGGRGGNKRAGLVLLYAAVVSPEAAVRAPGGPPCQRRSWLPASILVPMHGARVNYKMLPRWRPCQFCGQWGVPKSCVCNTH